MRWLKKVLSPPLLVLAALIVLFEEFLWVHLTQFGALIGRLGIVRALETRIARLPAHFALPLFLIPVIALVPFKLLALWLIANGHAIVGIEVFIAAKVVGTAIAARLFVLCRPALMSKPWFASLYDAIMAFRLRVYTQVRRMRAYRLTRIGVRRGRAWLRRSLRRRAPAGGLGRRWEAIRRARRMRRLRAGDR